MNFSRENIWKPPKKRRGNISPNSKKITGKGKESYIFNAYIIFNITCGGLLGFFDVKLTSFKNKNYGFL